MGDPSRVSWGLVVNFNDLGVFLLVCWHRGRGEEDVACQRLLTEWNPQLSFSLDVFSIVPVSFNNGSIIRVVCVQFLVHWLF